jgi:lysophospholipase L1-like esterase
VASVKLLTWEDSAGHPNLVLRQGMRDFGTSEDGFGTPTRVDLEADYNISSLNGVNPRSPARGVRYDVSGNSLEVAHYYHLEVSRDHFQNPTSQSNYLMSNGSGGVDHRAGSNHDVFMGTEPGANADYDNCRAEIGFFGKSNFVSIDIMCTASSGEQRYFIDGLEANPATFNGGDATPLEGNYNDFYAAGLTTITSDWQGDTSASSNAFYARNFFVLTSPLDVDYDDDLALLFLGDSLTVEGSMSPWYGLPNGTKRAPWIPTTADAVGTDYGNGFMSDGTSASLPSNFRDNGYLPTVFRYLANQEPPVRPTGFNTVAGSNGNYAQSGGTLSDARAHYATAIASGYKPTTVFCGIGTNDVIASTGADTFEADYKALIDDIVANGASRVVIWTIISLRNDPTYQTAAFDAVTDELNEKIRGLNGYKGVTVVVDAFNTFTPNHWTNPSDFRAAGNIHPSDELSNQLGSAMAAAYFRPISSAASATLAPKAMVESLTGEVLLK